MTTLSLLLKMHKICYLGTKEDTDYSSASEDYGGRLKGVLCVVVFWRQNGHQRYDKKPNSHHNVEAKTCSNFTRIMLTK